MPGIAALVHSYAQTGALLPRTGPEIAAGLDDWVVAIADGAVLGCGSLVAYSPALTEVRSMAVAPRAKRKGIGMAIGKVLVEEARGRGVRTLLALTRATGFFEKLGFKLTVNQQFPEKVWRDCRLCPIQDRCDEVAMVLSLDGV